MEQMYQSPTCPKSNEGKNSPQRIMSASSPVISLDTSPGKAKFLGSEPDWTTKEAAEHLKLSTGTLRNWRSQHPDRLPFKREGRMIRYEPEVVKNFFKELETA